MQNGCWKIVDIETMLTIDENHDLNDSISDIQAGPSMTCFYVAACVQVNLFKRLSFLNQLTHNMTRDCSLNSLKNTSSQHFVYKYCFECQNKNKKTIFVHNMF